MTGPARLRNAARRARQTWRDREARAIGAYVYADPDVLADEPRLRGLIDNDLRRQIDEVRAPLAWRRADVRWALANLWRAARGSDPEPLPYEVITTIETGDNELSARLEFGAPHLVMIRAERRRRPVRRG